MRYMKCILVTAVSLALFACGKTGTATGTGVISLNGGNGGTSAGGNGGIIFTPFSHSTSMVHGDLRFHLGGAVNAVFIVPIINPDFGSNPATITSNSIPTTVQSALSVASGSLLPVGSYFVVNGTGDNNLYHVDTAGLASTVTGLTVNGGATLQLPSVNGFTLIPAGIVINGTVTNTISGESIDLQSGTFIQINGLVITKPKLTDLVKVGGKINLSSGGTLINLGTVDASGSDGTGVSGGVSGGVTLHAVTFLFNTGIINAKGGNSDTGVGGAGGAIQFLADEASFSTSGAIDSSGGNGTIGGAAGAITAFGGTSSSVIGRVYVEGTVTGNGGTGTTGDGGGGAAISLTSFSGGILISATISAYGGEGKVTGNGGAGGSLQLANQLGNDNAVLHQVSPEGIKVAGNISLYGGLGAGQGGTGGMMSVASDTAPNSLPGFGSVEFFGYQDITLNGGASTIGAGGAGGTVTCGISSPVDIVGFLLPAGGVVNEVPIIARGGDNSPASAAKTDVGGKGGSVVFTTPQNAFETADPVRTLVTSSGGFDISGGAGTTGGAGGSMSMSGYGNVTVSGGITSTGGTGTILGGAGASINLFSSSNVVSSGGIVVGGGAGINGGSGGTGGTVTLNSGNQTSTAGIGANGGNSATNGGNGGAITLFSGFALTLRNGLNVARGSGGSANSAINGTITIDKVSWATTLPLSGSI
jgi:hypothetical protein